MSSAQFQRIFVALDASPRAPAVLRAAVELAERVGARLLVFRAVGVPHELPAEALNVSPSDLPALLQVKGREDLEKLAESVPRALIEEIMVEVGSAGEAICRLAAERGADLIVIGSHGYSGIERLIGTTASRVVNHADRSVLVIRR